MARQPIPLDLLRLRRATAACAGVAHGCRAAAEAFAQSAPGDDPEEPARELVIQIETALDPDRSGSPAAVLVALRGVLAQ